MSELKTSPKVSHPLLEGFKGVRGIISSLVGNKYYKLDISWKSKTSKRKFKEPDTILAIHEEFAPMFIKESDDVITVYDWRIEELFKNKFKIDYENYKIENISNISEIDYSIDEIPEDAIIVRPEDIYTMFQFTASDTPENIDIGDYIDNYGEPSAFAFSLIKMVKDAVKNEDIEEYEALIDEFHNSLIHEIVKYIPRDDFRYLEPLFSGDNPKIFDYMTLLEPYFDYPIYDEDDAIALTEMRNLANNELTSFISEVLVNAVKNGKKDIVSTIVERATGASGYLLRHCMYISENSQITNILKEKLDKMRY